MLQSWVLTTGVGMVLVVLAFAFAPMLGSLPTHLLEHWSGPQVVWDREVVWAISGLLLFALLATAGGLVVNRRRRELI